MSILSNDTPTAGPRQRLTRESRRRQLLDVAWRLVGDEGTDALTLGRLAQNAGVAKPVVYSQFGTRAGLLSALYEDFDARQTVIMDAAFQNAEPTLSARAAVISGSYVDCVLRQGREISGVIAALAGTPELDRVKREYQNLFIEKCRAFLEPCSPAGRVSTAGLCAMLGAAEALSSGAAAGALTAAEAKTELTGLITEMVARRR